MVPKLLCICKKPQHSQGVLLLLCCWRGLRVGARVDTNSLGAAVVVMCVCVYSTFVEIIGRVNSDGTVDEQRSVSFGDKFGMSSSVVCRSAAQHSES